MKRLPLIALTLSIASPLAAHPGHVADSLGHDHWVAGAAIGAAIAVGIWGALKGRRDKKKTQASDAPTAADTQDA